MTADPWTRVVRQQVGLGRLLPLGGARDGGWITEAAAEAVLRGAAAEVPGVCLGRLRITLAEPDETDGAGGAGGIEGTGEAAAGEAEGASEAGETKETDRAEEAEGAEEAVVPAPPSALPPGPLRVAADFAATAAAPLPETASRLRLSLATAADQRLGLTVTEVDLRITELLDGPADPPAARAPQPAPAREGTGPDEIRAATAALSVPGVVRLTGSLGGLGRGVHCEVRRPGPGASPRRHVRVELAVAAGHRPRDVVRQVRTAVAAALEGRATVAVLVTAVG
ncbi:nucleopolyhedrovirus P10 family protein [Streptomyces sp. NPDC102462]|uniref:nucleopolyhedrovirus P10 family protein n=1 Tax=Streptomyces sp. NPDC102462 TaxID=3366178 RepID=UPI0038034245